MDRVAACAVVWERARRVRGVVERVWDCEIARRRRVLEDMMREDCWGRWFGNGML